MIRVFTLAAIFLAVAAGTAAAGPIGPDCKTCQGSIYTLTKVGQVDDLYAGDGLTDTWQFVLEIDTTGYTGAGVRIDEVAIKISSGVDDILLSTAPGGVGAWTLVGGGINGNGCSGKGSGFECADWMGTTGGAVVPGILRWTFNIDIAGDMLDDPFAASIKARYVDESGNKVGDLVSENITVVPEPATWLLMSSGLVLAVRQLRRRRV